MSIYQCLMLVLKDGKRTLIVCNRRFLTVKQLQKHQDRWH